MPSPPTFWRSPRIRPEPPREEIEIQAPPAAPSTEGSLLTTLLPVFLMVVVMVFVGYYMSKNGAGGGLMFMMMIPMILATSLASVIIYFRQKRQNEEKAARRIREYHRLLAKYKKTLQALQRDQQKVAYFNDPSPKECLSRVSHLKPTLWTRTPNDDDYLKVRVGLGTRPSTIKVKTPKPHDPIDPDPLILAAQELEEQFALVPNMPLHLAIREMGITGIVGAKELALDAFRSVAIQLATHHAPTEVKLMAVYHRADQAHWRWIRWLPHVWDDTRERRFLADDEDSSRELFLYLDELLDKRRQRVVESTGNEKPVFSPDIVIIFAAPHLTENEPVIHRIVREGPELGIYSIFIRESHTQLPQNSRAYIRLTSEMGRLVLLGKSIKNYFSPDRTNIFEAQQFARAIAPIRLKQSQTQDIPTSVALLDLFGVKRLEDLDILQRWQRSQQASRSLITPIGMQRGGKLRTLDLHERKDGPNGLVAGMVGAGKSVLLETLVASLAVNYHPHRVAFVLIDFKGGGMAKPFENLPHTLGVITNLQEGNLAVRALTSLRVEANRRQALFDKAGVNHIDDYQRAYYRGEVAEPLPYLVIIVDEFAEMKSEMPDVAKDFVKIARLGRALGFRLILAMQKPAGIVDGQIEANTRFRICLRVAQTEDSRAMLKRPDAAYLSGNGRAYLQVGANEVFELFQVAWGGAPYDPEGILGQDPNEIALVHLNGRREVLYAPEKPPVNNELSQLKALTNYLIQVAQEQRIERLKGLWLPPLPEKLPLDRVRPDEGWNGETWSPAQRWLAPIVGLMDNPNKQEQTPLYIDFGNKGGHLAVYGEPGSGKTTFLQTLITSLALSYSPADVNIYVVDFGGRLLKMFEGLPHVGGVVSLDEDERFHRLMDFLLREMEHRRELFGKAKVATLKAYRNATNEPLPAIIVVIDNYANLYDAYEEAEEKIIRLTRDGGNLGIHLVLTATSASSIRFRVSSNITHAIALNLVDKGDYSAIVGRTEVFPANIRGRGLVRREPTPLEFQTALPGSGNSDLERNMNLKAMIETMNDMWKGPRARPIPQLPQVVLLSDIFSILGNVNSSNGDKNLDPQIPLGLIVKTLDPFVITFNEGPHFLITGVMQSGKTTLLQTWLQSMMSVFQPEDLHVYLVDSRKLGLSQFAHSPHVQSYVADSRDVSSVLSTLEELLAQREYQLLQTRKGAFQFEDTLSQSYPILVFIVDDFYDPFNDLTTENDKERLGILVRKGRSLGLHLILAGPDSDLSTKGWQDPIKSLKEAQVGFILGSSSSDIFSLRLPYGERDKLLPPGEGYWFKRGIATRVKIAVPKKSELEKSVH